MNTTAFSRYMIGYVFFPRQHHLTAKPMPYVLVVVTVVLGIASSQIKECSSLMVKIM